MWRSRHENVTDATDRRQQVFLFQFSLPAVATVSPQIFTPWQEVFLCCSIIVICRKLPAEVRTRQTPLNLILFVCPAFKTAFCCRQILKPFRCVNHTFYGECSVSESSCCPEWTHSLNLSASKCLIASFIIGINPFIFKCLHCGDKIGPKAANHGQQNQRKFVFSVWKRRKSWC